ncbi:MAG: hypothetical protein WC623_21365 [Pedobacter sp.]|uniref:hypothetical protein n=1 Tax=Pedobacter sp. TaxID=1411316 RepID=UPI0035665D30
MTNTREINISRLWDFDKPLSIEPDIELLFKRPRIDYRVSEYVFQFIDTEILQPNRVLQKGKHHFCLAFGIYNPEIHKFHQENPYHSDDSKFSISKYNRKEYKDTQIACNSTLFNENISPVDYAKIVYDMFACYLVQEFKKITKELMDSKKNDLDINCITDFDFPAKFENHKYISDNTSIEFTQNDGQTIKKNEPIVIADIYKNRYAQ